MSRTIIRYDPEDIDFKDPIHSFLMSTIIISAIGFRKEPGEDPDLLMKRLIANVLNTATDAGISISKSEIPAAFLRTSAPPA
jgi:hypothetical protein